MRAFIVRPFGVQQDIDFDRVHAELIEPALALLRQMGTPVDGGTTGLISKQGNIREDMFRLLAVSDLVIADVTIHNANAFYELGIRHALRDGSTFMIRAKDSKFKYPFDLQTDRYFQYDLANLAKDIEPVALGIRATLAERKDSPIYLLLKDLKPHGRGDLVKAPEDFREAVQVAENTGRRGDLRLLAHECAQFEWDREGLTMVGEAQFGMRAYPGARETFELLRVPAPDDYHPNWRLGTIYQRLALAADSAEKKAELITSSDQRIQRALKSADPAQKAELNAMLGSNAKNRWVDDFRADDPDQRRRRALESPCLEQMLTAYLNAAAFDLDAHYPAVNALALLKAQTELAKQLPDVWEGLHESQAAARQKEREDLAERLAANLRLTLRLDDYFKTYQTPADKWSKSSIADLYLLRDPGKKEVIANRFRDANSGAKRFSLDANRRNLEIFKSLGLFEPGVTAALEVIDAETKKTDPPESSRKLALLFTGHRVDAIDREPEKRRFPPTPEAEATARKLIYDAVKLRVGADAADTIGIGGGASGGDILFHEVCAELGIRTELFLVVPAPEFQKLSVQDGGEQWVARYQALCAKLPTRVLQPSQAPPDWLAGSTRYDLWERNNMWMLFNILATWADRQTLIALYNQELEPDGAGGTKHLIEEAENRGVHVVRVDARALLK
jgi:hypothetical protein